MACLYPRLIRLSPSNKYVTVSCRKCHNCKIQKQTELEFGCLMSLLQGYKFGTGASFVTLTYNNDYLPLVSKDDKFYGTLDKKQFNLWWQKVRKVFRDRSQYVPQFMACGEYGSDFDRPHYHVLVFGSNFNEFRNIALDCWKKENNYMGLVDCKPLRQGAIRYVVDYIMKENDLTFQKYDYLGLQRPFLRHSTRLGLDYFWNDFDYDPADFTYLRNGKRCLIPGFYRKKLPGGEQFDYENISSIETAYEEGLPLEVYTLSNAFNNAELDILRKRQRQTPAESLSDGLKNYLTSSLDYFRKSHNYKMLVREEFRKLGLPTEKSFYTPEVLDTVSPEKRKEIIDLIVHLE